MKLHEFDLLVAITKKKKKNLQCISTNLNPSKKNLNAK